MRTDGQQSIHLLDRGTEQPMTIWAIWVISPNTPFETILDRCTMSISSFDPPVSSDADLAT